MRDKILSLSFKSALVILIIDIFLLFIVKHDSAEWVICWVTFASLFIFCLISGIIIGIKSRKEIKDETKEN